MGTEAPEVAKDSNDLQQSGLRIGTCHDCGYAMQPAAERHFVKHGFEQSPARPEPIINGEPRHARLRGDGLRRESADPLRRAENRRRRSDDPLTRLGRGDDTAGAVVGARAHVTRIHNLIYTIRARARSRLISWRRKFWSCRTRSRTTIRLRCSVPGCRWIVASGWRLA